MEDKTRFMTSADGSVRLFITVEAPGYNAWERIRWRMNWTTDRPVYITVEMEWGLDL